MKKRFLPLLTISTIAFLGIVIYTGNVLTVNTSKITDIICLVAFTAMPVSGIVCTMCFLIPLHSGITGLYIYGYAVLMILLKTKQPRIKMIIPLCIVIMYELIMMLFVETAQFSNIIVYALTVFLLLYMMNAKDINPKSACISYICGALVLLVCIFTTAIQEHSLQMILSGFVRIGEYEDIENIGQVAVVTENANAMAYYALIAIVMALNMIKNEKIVGRLLLLSSIIVLTVIALFTISRTFVIVLVIMLALFFLTGNNFKQRIKVLAIIALILAIVVPYLQENTQIFEAFTERFEDENLATGTGRTEIFIEYMRFLWENPLRLIFGTGATFYREICNFSHSMHNGTQQILVSYGLVGFLPIMIFLFGPIFAFFRKNKFKLIKILPILAVVLFTQTIQFLNPNNLMLPYAVAMLCMKIPDAEDVE